MQSTFIGIAFQDFSYVGIAIVLLGIVAFLARATERRLHSGAGLDSFEVDLMNKLRLVAGLAALILLIMAWRLALPLSIAAMIVSCVIAGRKKHSVSEGVEHETDSVD